MPDPISFGELDFQIVSSMEVTQGAPKPETPFRIAILGDFSGKRNRGIVDSALTNRRPLLVDRDNIDDVLKKLNVEIEIPIMGEKSPPVRIKFSEFDDFHPDSLFDKLDIFQALRDTRNNMKDPVTFAEYTGALQNKETPAPAKEPDISEQLEKTASQTPTDFLDEVLDKTEDTSPETGQSGGLSEWDNFLRQIVQPHVVPDIEPQQNKIIASIDAATSEFMRMVLHHPDFLAMESAWRSVHFLISRLETEEKLKLYLIDISKDELAADVAFAEDLRTTGTFKLLVEQTVETFGGEPWAVLAGNYTFDQSPDDIAILGRMAKIAKAAGAPFIAAAHDSIMGCESLARTPDPDNWNRDVDEQDQEAWTALRQLPEAAYLGLALPRFILRLPYGEDTDEIERFEFEEMPDISIHNLYLWGNGAIACAYLLGHSFSQHGWNFQPGSLLDIEGLPLHIYKEGSESRTKACAEVVFTEQAVEMIFDKGIMPLLSFKEQDRVRLARVQCLSDPPTNLGGRWE